MTVLKQGNLTLEASENAVTFRIDGCKADSRVCAEDLGEVIAFLLGHSRRQKEQRTGFRVPLTKDVLNALPEPFRVELYLGRHQYIVNPRNLSLTGILVEGVPVEGVRVGDEMMLHLGLGMINITLQGIVRRNPEQQLGIEFPQTRKAEELDPPDELVAIFKLLESNWLKYRVQP
jgi:hypothetical protein